jgi:hypothetical protein
LEDDDVRDGSHESGHERNQGAFQILTGHTNWFFGGRIGSRQSLNLAHDAGHDPPGQFRYGSVCAG